MAKLKKHRLRKLVCSTCKGNGYLKVGTEWGDTIHQCWDCDSEENFMRLQIILLVTMTVIVIMTSSCTRDIDLNPWTTIVKHAIKQ